MKQLIHFSAVKKELLIPHQKEFFPLHWNCK